MDHPNPDNMIPTPVKVAAPVILLAPIAMPIIHGVAGIAVVGLGLFAAGSLVSKAVNVFSGSPKPEHRQDDSPSH
jgi:hypothetical protein